VKASDAIEAHINSSEPEATSPTLTHSLSLSLLAQRVVPRIRLARCIVRPSVCTTSEGRYLVIPTKLTVAAAEAR
jgi:hypothetical protein